MVGFYFRQSARFGPFRINFSKSGIGISAGIKGLRLGTGPRGAYIHAGVAGLYYRQSLEPTKGRSARVNVVDSSTPIPQSPVVPSEQYTLGAVELIDSGSVLKMKDSSGSGLVHELEICRNRVAWAPWCIGLVAALIIFALWKGNWIVGLAGALCVPAAYWMRIRDIQRKGFVLQYDLDDGATKAVTDLVEACEKIAQVGRSWYMDSSQQVLNAKYHAGASSVVKRSSTRLAIQEPPYLRANIPIPGINMGKETLFFLPDRLLVYAGSAIGEVAYRDLRLEVKEQQFIESSKSSVPSDATVVGRTWRYVNKKGGPDRRFKNNPEMPVALYEEISLSSPTGLREVLQLSKVGIGQQLLEAVALVNKATANGKAIVRAELRGDAGETPAFQTA
jgi:hypothetical protein